MENNFHSRQTGLIDPAKLTQKIFIVGAGSIGGWTALGLLKLGCKDVTVADFDVVEEQNIGPQLYSPGDIGKKKVKALAVNLLRITGEMIKENESRINSKSDLSHYDIVIAGVDTIKARKGILTAVVAARKKGKNIMLIDGRMEANEIQIYSVAMDETGIEEYKKTLFDEKSATPIACSMRSVVYNCLIISGLITDIVAHVANGQKIPQNLEVDLMNFELHGGLLNGN